MPRDPADQSWKTMNTVDSVASQPGFIESITKVVEAAFDNPVLVVGCRRGRHRSPVVAVGAAEILQGLGFSVAIVELELVQPFLYVSTVTVAQDDRLRSRLAPLTQTLARGHLHMLPARATRRVEFPNRSEISILRAALAGSILAHRLRSIRKFDSSRGLGGVHVSSPVFA